MNHTMPYDLCDDLIAEIIERLPAKSLIRNRALSKSWYRRIADRGFIRAHALRSSLKTPKEVIVRQRLHHRMDQILYSKESSVDFPVRNYHVFGSCNGIVCLHARMSINPSIILWNPSIGRKQIVPKHPYGNLFLGFGFDTMTDDYKIVGISCAKSDQQKLYIYTLKTNSWSEIASPFSFGTPVSPACFFNQAFHWVVNAEDDHPCIITFNLSSHVLGMISLPEPKLSKIQLTIVKRSLAVISTNDFGNIWMWMRRECNNVASWSNGFNLTNIAFEADDSGSNCDELLSNNYYEDFEGFNPESGVRSRFVVFTNSEYGFDMDMCVESLELFDKETC